MIQIRDLTWRESEIINAGRCIVFLVSRKELGYSLFLQQAEMKIPCHNNRFN